MGIFDVFTFKKDLGSAFSKENISAIFQIARKEIIEQAKKNIPGPEKKAIVDEIIIHKIESLKFSCKNSIVLGIIDKVIEVIPLITQLIYEFLKEKVEEL